MSDPVAALEDGRAFVNLSSWWKVGVEGEDAEGWLNDLLSAELSGLLDGATRHSLLLTPTGRIRAEVTVAAFEGGFVLVQDPAQPERIDALLDRYVLSSDVRLGDRTEELGLFSLPGANTVLTVDGERPTATAGLVEAGVEDLDAARIRRGVARFPVDLTTDSLPHEVELGDVVAYGKGCFLGQEAVAKVRNLGHPPFVVLAGSADEPVSAGDVLLSEDREAGAITSSAPAASGGTAVIARVRWALKDSVLETALGVVVSARGLASAA